MLQPFLSHHFPAVALWSESCEVTCDPYGAVRAAVSETSSPQLLSPALVLKLTLYGRCIYTGDCFRIRFCVFVNIYISFVLWYNVYSLGKTPNSQLPHAMASSFTSL